jgi:hypothetical protein
MRLTVIGAIAIATSGAAPATANWQYTTWGMSQAQLAAVSPNIRPTTSSEEESRGNPYIGRAKLKAGYIADGLQYTVYFWFQNDKLVTGDLEPIDPTRGPTAGSKLESIYGKPFANDLTRNLGCENKNNKWRSERDGNVIRFDQAVCYSVKDGSITLNLYSVRYEPLFTSKGTGL